jgi:hypothetical protein
MDEGVSCACVVIDAASFRMGRSKGFSGYILVFSNLVSSKIPQVIINHHLLRYLLTLVCLTDEDVDLQKFLIFLVQTAHYTHASDLCNVSSPLAFPPAYC